MVKLPDVGEGVAEAEIVEWHVAVGDTVEEEQVLAAVMTDKVTVEIPSPFAGVILDLGGEVGARLAVGSALVRIKIDAERDSVAKGSEAAGPNGHARSAAAIAPQMAVTVNRRDDVQARKDRGNTDVGLKTATARERPIASPAIRARAREAGVDLRQLAGSGTAGRITQQDLADFIDARPVNVSRPRQTPRADRVTQIKVTGLRRKIAERMAESTRRIAHFSYVEEIDVTALDELRQQLNAKFIDRRPKLTVLPFVVTAMVLALRDFPQMNGTYDDENEVVHRHSAVHVGIATQTASGLMVPVLRHAEARDLWDCAEEIKGIADAARSGSAAREDLNGSTITVTSLGDLGGIVTTPVINRPELAIIGVNRMTIRPLWQQGQFVPRTTMNLSSSFDHRIIDGYEAAQFIRCIKEFLEAPALLLVGA
ncbi:branched-chain alpha-keto acid dehydrogenase subunit E2 [Bradyrhizobium lablabi]|uniref:Dihydrolipoamide acetyltransferase component of pyruvate dehydrogenase complex n=2 Tax=Bradyrhizobium lablabi TaxID=722472 RepID=A0A0R3NCR8_9BRAD|nr:branched-chain alpha-keto acid dehydrogenase subunit E2 [Bradyrhizobium lablabi]